MNYLLDFSHIVISHKEWEVEVEVVVCGHGVDDEVEAVGRRLHALLAG